MNLFNWNHLPFPLSWWYSGASRSVNIDICGLVHGWKTEMKSFAQNFAFSALSVTTSLPDLKLFTLVSRSFVISCILPSISFLNRRAHHSPLCHFWYSDGRPEGPTILKVFSLSDRILCFLQHLRTAFIFSHKYLIWRFHHFFGNSKPSTTEFS